MLARTSESADAHLAKVLVFCQYRISAQPPVPSQEAVAALAAPTAAEALQQAASAPQPPAAAEPAAAAAPAAGSEPASSQQQQRVVQSLDDRFAGVLAKPGRAAGVAAAAASAVDPPTESSRNQIAPSVVHMSPIPSAAKQQRRQPPEPAAPAAGSSISSRTHASPGGHRRLPAVSPGMSHSALRVTRVLFCFWAAKASMM